MGAVDLVIQVESPKSVARGLQRIGRAGPRRRRRRPRGGSSRSSAPTCSSARCVAARCARARSRRPSSRATRSTCSPSRSSRSPWPTRSSRAVGRAARPRARAPTLRRALARPARERARHARRALPLRRVRRAAPADRLGPQRRHDPRARGRRAGWRSRTPARSPTAGCSGSRCRDGRRVGELDEEMVYEARAGQTFLLGASTWRIEEITRDRVIVTPAPGAPGAVPFWKGDGVGRPKELGEAIGAFARWAVDAAAPRCSSATTSSTPRGRAQPARVPARAARGDRRRPVRPHDRRRALPRRDRRLAGVHPLALRRPRPRRLGDGARRRGSASELGLECESIWSDDGIVAPPPRRRGAAAVPSSRCSTPTEVEDSWSPSSASTALFGARFRENAARALLIPRADPGQRTPLWQQRLKAQSLLAGRARYGSFPIVLETYRECLQRRLRPAGAARAARRAARRELSLVEVETADRLAVRLLAAFRLRRHLHVRGRHAARRAARRGALARPRPAARAARPGGAARPARPRRARRGRRRACSATPRRRRAQPPTSCTTCCGCAATSARRGRRRLAADSIRRRCCGTAPERRALSCGSPVRSADRRRGRGALPRRARRDPPGGLPEAFLESGPTR